MINDNKITKINKGVGIFLIALFITTFSLFYAVQYVNHGPSFYMYKNFTGLDLAFGLTIEGGRKGFFPFFLPVVFSCIGLILAGISLFPKSKAFLRVLFYTCSAIALISLVIYLLTYFFETNRYGDQRGAIKWTFAFWLTFSLYCSAFIVSLLAGISNRVKPTKN